MNIKIFYQRVTVFYCAENTLNGRFVTFYISYLFSIKQVMSFQSVYFLLEYI